MIWIIYKNKSNRLFININKIAITEVDFWAIGAPTHSTPQEILSQNECIDSLSCLFPRSATLTHALRADIEG